MIKPKVCILRADGTNCDVELHYAFEKFGGAPEYVHVNQLRAKSKKLAVFQILALPGGFSYGDDVASGKILAVELVSFLKDQIQEFVAKKGLIIGICNGFQVLVRTGLLPFNRLGQMDATLAQNSSGHFECRWVRVKLEKSNCVFLNKTPTFEVKSSHTSKVSSSILELPVNHGEGKFFANNETMLTMEQSNLVVFRYVNPSGNPTQHYPENPNGSINAIAGVTDPTGRILGMMPHPEKFVDITQHPNWRRWQYNPKGASDSPSGGFIFKQMIDFIEKS